jgi:Na+/H+ antiporter NhaD/arsenite permease-like protein
MPGELPGAIKDYSSFIILLASLFTISGGIVITGGLKATPSVTTAFLPIGAVSSNIIGTTGASMLLIRPLLQTIRGRKRIAHIPVFFIFLVSNIGGCLTPLGAPPLFLGYLRGVPFVWTLRFLPIWATTVGILLVVFFIWDLMSYRREDKADLLMDGRSEAALKVRGSANLLFLARVIAAVFFQLQTPYRELVMILMAALSMAFTKRELREANGFTFGPISEVAVLFAGVFITMIPLLILLAGKGAALGVVRPWQFFWTTGAVSSFLDNAPTYLTFSSLAKSVTAGFGEVGVPIVHGVGIRQDLLTAISCGAVFMGALTYVGNGPNLMVKSIAEEQGVTVPHFFGYMLYSSAVLLPVLFLITLFFFPRVA